MLKRLSIWFLIFAVFIANFSMALEYVGFKLNQKYIAQNLCVNRFKPSMHCNGKCYFMRKIKQAEDSEKKQAARGSSGRLEITFFKEPVSILFEELWNIDKEAIRFQAAVYIYNSQYLDSIFRPPKANSSARIVLTDLLYPLLVA